jgi:hypothetical protein
MKKYFIADNHGDGLHYIRGNLYWRPANTFENIENFTSFHTKKDTLNFIAERLQPIMPEYQFQIGVITTKIGFL